MPTRLPVGKLSFLYSLKVKFTLVVIFLFILIFGVFSFMVIRNFVNNEKNNLINQAKAFALLGTRPIADTYNIYYSSGYLKFKELIENTLSLNKDIEKIQIINVGGEVLFDSKEFETEVKPTGLTDPDIIKKVAANSTSYVYDSNSEIKEIIDPFFEDFGAHPFSVRYFISYESINQVVASIRNTAIAVSIIFLLLSTGLIVLVINRLFLSPIKKVIDAARQISGGDLSKQIIVNTGDEIEELATSVNHMAQTLKNNIQSLLELDKLKDEFIMIASHNLRTPLMTINGYLSYFKKAKLEPQYSAYLNHIETSLKELYDLIEELIGIASLESKKESLDKEKLDIKALFEESTKGFSSLASEKKINFVFEFPPNRLPSLEIDKTKMTQAINNLIDNAIKFNKEGGQVKISVKKKEGSLLISISDTGIGIEKDKEHLVFTKFFRGTSTLTYNYEGAGLGLYVTKLIINAHGGKIWFEGTPGKGATFYFTLPIK